MMRNQKSTVQKKSAVSALGKILFLLLLTSLIACGEKELEETTEPPQSVTVNQKPTPTPILQEKDLELLIVKNTAQSISKTMTGRVIPRNQTAIFAEVQGSLLPGDVTLKEGVSFRKGATLIRVDSEEYRLNLESKRAGFLNALTGLMPDLKADYPESYAAWLSYVQNYNAGNNLPALPDPKSDGEKFLVTSNQIYSQYFGIKATEQRLRKYRITAPYSGTIAQANIDLGGMVSPGQPLLNIMSSNNYEVETGADLQTASRLKIGDKVTFSSNDTPGEWLGTVVRTGSSIDAKTQKVPVFFRLTGKGLRAGMYLQGSVQTNSTETACKIPSTALARDNSVLVLENNVLTRKLVEPVEYLDNSVIIRGVQDNDRIILNQFNKPMDGKRVAI